MHFLLAQFPYFEKIKVCVRITLQCVWLCPPQSIVEPTGTAIARQGLSKHITMTINAQATTEELLDVAIFIWSTSYQIPNM
jgi:hypothetical protein